MARKHTRQMLEALTANLFRDKDKLIKEMILFMGEEEVKQFMIQHGYTD
jgi:hypothetical protein